MELELINSKILLRHLAGEWANLDVSFYTKFSLHSMEILSPVVFWLNKRWAMLSADKIKLGV